MSEALAVVVGGGAVQTMDTAPAIVLAEAQKAAAALHDVIKRKPKPVQINGETYLEYEDWQLLGRFYGYSAGLEGEPEYVEMGGASGFKATAVALDARGQVRSRATAFCMNDEERWQKAPTYQLASMAQTRANAKVLRNVLSCIAVLAGYKPTPAEEMDGVHRAAAPPRTGEKPACPECKTAEQVIVGKYPDKRTGVKKPWYCLKHKIAWGNSEAAQEPEDEPWIEDGPQE